MPPPPIPAFRLSAAGILDRFTDVEADVAASRAMIGALEASNRSLRQWLATLGVVGGVFGIVVGVGVGLAVRETLGVEGRVAAVEGRKEWVVDKVTTKELVGAKIWAENVFVASPGLPGAIRLGVTVAGTIIRVEAPMENGAGMRSVTLLAKDSLAGLSIDQDGWSQGATKGGQFVAVGSSNGPRFSMFGKEGESEFEAFCAPMPGIRYIDHEKAYDGLPKPKVWNR